MQRPRGSTRVACLRSTGEAPGTVTEGRREEERSGVGRARARGVDLILSTVRSWAHGEHREGGTSPPREGWAWREWGPSPLGVGTIGSQSCTINYTSVRQNYRKRQGLSGEALGVET